MGTSNKFRSTPTEIEAAQKNFDFLIPYQHRKHLTTEEVAGILGRKADFVRQLVEEGKLESLQDSAFGTRLSNRITRRSVAVHLARISTLTPEEFAEILYEALTTLSPEARQKMVARLTKLHSITAAK